MTIWSVEVGPVANGREGSMQEDNCAKLVSGLWSLYV